MAVTFADPGDSPVPEEAQQRVLEATGRTIARVRDAVSPLLGA
jgi:hypothetical protein